jgi:hypothetical protein
VFSSEAKRLVKADLENICLENVQACILVGNICLAESNPDSESLYFGRRSMYLIWDVTFS